jgi:hypothetical protein
MSGFMPVYEDESSDVRIEQDGVPFKIAVLAAIEEVVGVLGDLNEGDAGGLKIDNPNIYEKLEKRRSYLENLTEGRVGGTHVRLNAVKKQVLDALIAEGEPLGYIDLLEGNKWFAQNVQIFLTGTGGKVTVEELVADAREHRLNDFLKAMGQAPAPDRQLGMSA